ncbi:LAMI_0G02234g1_1 [Lachancea mirantina]|uniref:LAMI_0G02234g1_1 n=1 Tax=Lachancea mirantina TaxID=1230905 RepID=A0A1G4K7P8_9SACH|nr:LAMI_0G02234g1_1 [Lachancea mirantina]
MTLRKSLFQHLTFVVVAKSESETWVRRAVETLRENQAHECIVHVESGIAKLPLPEAKRKLLQTFGHDVHCIIAQNSDFWFYETAAFDLLIPVVKPEWVHACATTGRITRASCFSPDPRHVLKNCQIYLSRHAFKAAEYAFYSGMITSLGGACIDYLSSKTTHIVTIDVRDPAILAVAPITQLNIKYVLPTWIMESFQSETEPSEEKHLLNTSATQLECSRKFHDLLQELDTADVRVTAGERPPYLASYTFYLSLDLALPASCYTFLINTIKTAGGDVQRHSAAGDLSRSDGDCLLIQNSTCSEYQTGRREKLQMGNFNWFFAMWSTQCYIAADAKLLFQPQGAPVFNNDELVLAYTNFLGQQRNYIQKLVSALGGISTTEFTRKNTHLVTGLRCGQKYDAALRWKDTCVVVNHVWLEDCLKQGQKLDPNLPTYQQIPAFNLLSKRLGQSSARDNFEISSSVDEDMAETVVTQNANTNSEQVPPANEVDEDIEMYSNFFGEPSELEDDDRDQLSPTLSPVVSSPTKIPEFSDEPLEKKELSMRQPSDLETGRTLIGIAEMKMELTTPAVEASAPEAAPEAENTAPLSPETQVHELQASAGHLVQATPSPLPPGSSQLMSSSSSRRAKEKATLKLHTDMEALNEFEKNLRKKRTANLLPEEVRKLKKLKEVEDKVKELLENLSPETTSKVRHKRLYNMRAVCTGCCDQLDDLDLAILTKLGVEISTEPAANSNTIIAPKKMRTAKFLISLSFHPLTYALLPNFITDLLEVVRGHSTKSISLPIEQYFIPDIDPDVLSKTHLQSKLFGRAGITTINLTSDIPGGQDVISSILTAHGAKTINVLPAKFQSTDIKPNETRKDAPTYFLIASKASQAKKFAKSCRDLNESGSVLVVEWNWCVESIFSLKADTKRSKYIVHQS